jgi:hypothetical protein
MSDEGKARILRQLGRDEEAYDAAVGIDEQDEEEDLLGQTRTERKSTDWVSQVLGDLRVMLDTLKAQSRVSQAVLVRALEHLNALERRIDSIEKAGTVARGLFEECKKVVRTMAERIE